jgi:hypothetical protein
MAFLFDELATVGTGEQSEATVLIVKVKVKVKVKQSRYRPGFAQKVPGS